MVNTQRILELADYIQAQPEENFDMGHWRCGTVACIGGHCEVMQLENFPNITVEEAYDDDLIIHPNLYLGLTEPQIDELFVPRNEKAFYLTPPGYPQHVSRDRALACLRNLAETGEVEW